jgi:hypothetical protein
LAIARFLAILAIPSCGSSFASLGISPADSRFAHARRLDLVKFRHSMSLENVYKLIKQWQPDDLPAEARYRDSLVEFLKEKLSRATIVKEYRHNGTTTDIYVKRQGILGSSHVFVELKRNLRKKSDLDRLMGQLRYLKPKSNYVIVVLCGDTEPAFVDLLRQEYSNVFGELEGFRTFAVVLKKLAARASK